MAKKTPRAKAIETLQKLVRLKAADDNGYCTCVTCGKVYYYTSMDAGHYIPKGISAGLALVEENIHPQCKGCNGFGMRYGDKAQAYTLYMIDMYGREFVDELHKNKNVQAKYYKRDYLEMTEGWNKQIKENIKRIGK